jgi:hypothetical protein
MAPFHFQIEAVERRGGAKENALRLQPHDRTRMTRGRCGSLRLHRNGLAPSTFRRSPGAPVHSIIRDWAGQAAGPAMSAMPR